MNEQSPLIHDAYDFGPPPQKPYEKLWEKLYRFFFGDDIFISYSRADAIRYVPSLAARLAAKRYICFFDQLAATPSEELPDRLKKKILRSTVFVLIGTQGAMTSSFVRKEVELFRRTQRPFIPIDVDGALVTQDRWREVVGMAKIHEDSARVRDGDPSPEVIQLIKDSFRYTRRSQWLRASLLVGISVILITMIVSHFVIRTAQIEANLIKQQADSEVAAANKRVGEADKKVGEAEQRLKVITDEVALLRTEAEDARNNANSALSQQKVAERAMQHAQQLERQSTQLAAEASRREAGSRAALLAREPGSEPESLALAVQAAQQSLEHEGNLPKEVMDGITASTMAADYSIQLEDAGVLLIPDLIISSGGEKILGTFADIRMGTTRWVLWDGQTGKIMSDISRHMLVFKSAFSRDSKRFASLISNRQGVSVWDLSTGQVKPVQTACNVGKILSGSALALNTDGTYVLVSGATYGSSGSMSSHSTICEIATGHQEELTLPYPMTIYDVAFTPENEPAIYGTYLSPSEGQFVPVMYFPRSNRTVELKADGPRLNPNFFAGLGDDGSVITITRNVGVQGQDRVYVQSRGGDVRRLTGYRGTVVSVAYVNRSARVVTTSGRSIRVADAALLPNFAALRGHLRQLDMAVFSPDDRSVLTVGDDGRGMLWDVETGRLRHTLHIGDEFLNESQSYDRMKRNGFRTAAFRMDSKRVVTSNEHGEIQTWDVDTGQPMCSKPGRRPEATNFLNAVSFLPGGDYVLAMYSKTATGRISLDFLDAQTCRLAGTFEFNEEYAPYLISVDGTALITGTRTPYKGEVQYPEWETPQLQTWSLRDLNLQSGEPIKLTPSNFGEPPGGLRAFSSDGTRLLVGIKNDKLKNDTLVLWQPGKASYVPLKGWQDWLRIPAAFSADAKRVATLSGSGLQVWDTHSGQLLLAFKPDVEVSNWTARLSLSSDGSKLLIVGKDHVVRIYPTSREDFFRVAKRLYSK